MAFPLAFSIPLFRISLEVYATASPASVALPRTGHTKGHEEPWGGKKADLATIFHGFRRCSRNVLLLLLSSGVDGTLEKQQGEGNVQVLKLLERPQKRHRM